MKTCYIGHEYHRKTASTNFLADFLEAGSSQFDRIDTTPDPKALEAFDMDALVAGGYDLICVFQIEMLAKRIAEARTGARLVYVPMYDGCRNLGDDYWQAFAHREDIRIVNFCATLHTRLAMLGVNSYRFQYYPEPGETPAPIDGRRAFYWQRTDRPSWTTVKTLLSGAPDVSVHLHLAGDPSVSAAVDVAAESAERDLTVSTWFEDPSDYRRIVDACDIYFSPREYEGIGMSFLEAMAAGKCVVAPDNPTMNEYITHGVNGLLYDVDAPGPLDFRRAAELGRAARASIVNGHRTWSWDFRTRMARVLFDETLPEPETFQEIGSFVRGPGAATFPATPLTGIDLPRVSVAMVCYNCRDDVAPTLDSILAQTYAGMEVVVVDGASTDGTREAIEAYRDRLDVFVSEPDKGVYDAMNKATALASGDYIVFINAGDFFHLPTALEEAMLNVFGPGGAYEGDTGALMPDFITGHHVYVHANGASGLHKAEDFDRTWAELIAGAMSPGWWSGIPCHQSTLTRRRLLAQEKYDLSFKITADHNFMFTQRGRGRDFAHSNSVVATYVGGGMSQKQAQLCIAESFRVAVTSSPDRDAVEDFYVRNFGPNAIIPNPGALEADARLLRESGLFYEDWYRMKYIRPTTRFQDPVTHFLMTGWKTNCQPNPFFDPEHYLLRNTDVYEAGMNPFVHYLRHGRQNFRPTYDWDSPSQAMSPFKELFLWYEEDIGTLEDKLARTKFDRLAGLMRKKLSS